jgi:hypothetical protein
MSAFRTVPWSGSGPNIQRPFDPLRKNLSAGDMFVGAEGSSSESSFLPATIGFVQL